MRPLPLLLLRSRLLPKDNQDSIHQSDVGYTRNKLELMPASIALPATNNNTNANTTTNSPPAFFCRYARRSRFQITRLFATVNRLNIFFVKFNGILKNIMAQK